LKKIKNFYIPIFILRSLPSQKQKQQKKKHLAGHAEISAFLLFDQL